jgi:hypothetical protein
VSAKSPLTRSGLTRRLPRSAVAAIVVVAAGLLAVGIAAGASATPAFFDRYGTTGREYKTLQESVHRGIACDKCHVPDRGQLVYRAGLVGEFYRTALRDAKSPRFVGMSRPTREACLSCHRYDWSDDAKRTSKIPHPAHLRVATEKRDCVTCHKWTGHVETYMQKHKAMPFSTVCASFGCHVGYQPGSACQNCHHVLQEGKGEWRKIHQITVRANGPNACLESCHDAGQCRLCHTTGKRPEFNSVTASASVRAIERQHVRKDWLARHGALALADQSKCFKCHVSVGECQDCHSRRPAFHGSQSTWIGRHKAFAKNKQRCLTCHQEKWCDACHKQFKEMR